MTPTEDDFPRPSPPAAQRRRGGLAALAAGLFLAGAVCGAGLTLWRMRTRWQPAPEAPAEVAARLNRQLAREYALTPGQEEELRAAVVARMDAIADLRARFNTETQRELDALWRDAERVIGREEAERLDRETRKHFNRHTGGHNRPDAHHGHGGHDGAP